MKQQDAKPEQALPHDLILDCLLYHLRAHETSGRISVGGVWV